MEAEGSALEILRSKFGFNEFRLHQQAIINSILEGRDTLAIMPTGGGKSMCYQIPALMKEGLAVVISPLIALMKDQVDSLRLNGVDAAFLNSTQHYLDQEEIISNAKQGKLKLLYLAPESAFLKKLSQFKVNLIAIDEAHCISQWGHDFRPEYLSLAQLKKSVPDIPVVALTATADSLTRKDIVEKLELKNPAVFISSFNRPTIRYSVEPKRNTSARLVAFLNARKEESGIIYCLSRASTERLASELQQKRFAALPYHAGLDRETRTKHQEYFAKDEVKIIVATIAFGMGIDKSNVRYVVHMDLPKNVEGYYQETGRAGRDGLPSEALLFYSYADVAKMRSFAEIADNAIQTEILLKKLQQMSDYGNLNTCRRQFLLNYFGEESGSYCGNCDNCLNRIDQFDGTIAAQKVLSAVTRLQERFGMMYVIDFLRGAQSTKIRDEHKQLKTYGVGADVSKDDWLDIIHQLVAQGVIAIDEGQYPTLKLTDASAEVLRGARTVTLTKVKEQFMPQPSESASENAPLLQLLKERRRELARDENVPAYVILSDASLKELAKFLPTNIDEVTHISGFGKVKTARYGELFVNLIRDYCKKNGLQSNMQSKYQPAPPQIRIADSGTKQETFDQFLAGKSIQQIAQARGLSTGTVESHLAYYVKEGKIPPHQLMDPARFAEIERVIEETGVGPLSPIKQILGDNYSYGEIRLVMAYAEFKQSRNE